MLEVDNKVSLSLHAGLWRGCNSKLRVCLVFSLLHTLAHSSMENDLHARVQTLARLRRGGIGVSDRWDSSGGTDRYNHLTSYTAPAAFLIPANSASPFAQTRQDLRRLLRPPRRWPCDPEPPISVMNSRRLMGRQQSVMKVRRFIRLPRRQS